MDTVVNQILGQVMEPVTWIHVVLGFLALLGGSFGGAVLKLVRELIDKRFRQHELNFEREMTSEERLWQEIGSLKSEISHLRQEVNRKGRESHFYRNLLWQTRLRKIVLMMEINSMLEDQGKPPKYDIVERQKAWDAQVFDGHESGPNEPTFEDERT